MWSQTENVKGVLLSFGSDLVSISELNRYETIEITMVLFMRYVLKHESYFTIILVIWETGGRFHAYHRDLLYKACLVSGLKS